MNAFMLCLVIGDDQTLLSQVAGAIEESLRSKTYSHPFCIQSQTEISAPPCPHVAWIVGLDNSSTNKTIRMAKAQGLNVCGSYRLGGSSTTYAVSPSQQSGTIAPNELEPVAEGIAFALLAPLCLSEIGDR